MKPQSDKTLMKIADLSVQLQDMGLQDLQENNQLLLDQLAIINQ